MAATPQLALRKFMASEHNMPDFDERLQNFPSADKNAKERANELLKKVEAGEISKDTMDEIRELLQGQQ